MMKRSVSRASKMSSDAQDFMENSFPGIPDAKWREFLEEEENNSFILSLREEIVQKCMEICFEHYLEKQAVAFTVHCAYLAWCKVINMYYMFRDPGDTEDRKVKESWEPDLEPEPSVIDSWGSNCIKPLDLSHNAKKKEKESSRSETTKSRNCEYLESCSFVSDLFDFGEGEYFFHPESRSSSGMATSVSRMQSIFTRTLSMSRESLPLLEPMVHLQGVCNDHVGVESLKKKEKSAGF